MKLLILCPRWGLEHLPLEDFFLKVKNAGYDGVDAWLPEEKEERKRFISLLHSHQLKIVAHQHQATGKNIHEYCQSLEKYLSLCMETDPLLINSHTGRDYFSIEDQLRALDTAQEFSVKNNIVIAHETHRGRIGYSPYNANELFAARPDMKITADFSHWTCVTESFLEHSETILQEAIVRTEHVHTRVGFTQGPQIPDPRLEAWQEPVTFFLTIWQRIIEQQKVKNRDWFTMTTEFGPPPYLWTRVEDNQPVASQWDINVYMKDFLREKLNLDL